MMKRIKIDPKTASAEVFDAHLDFIQREDAALRFFGEVLKKLSVVDFSLQALAQGKVLKALEGEVADKQIEMLLEVAAVRLVEHTILKGGDESVHLCSKLLSRIESADSYFISVKDLMFRPDAMKAYNEGDWQEHFVRAVNDAVNAAHQQQRSPDDTALESIREMIWQSAGVKAA